MPRRVRWGRSCWSEPTSESCKRSSRPRSARHFAEHPEQVHEQGKERARKAHERAVAQEKKFAAEEGREPREIESFETRLTLDAVKEAQERLTKHAQRLREADLRVTPWANLLLGTLELAERNTDRALEHLLAAEKAEPRLPGLRNRLGQVYLRERRNEDAERAFRKALDIDGDSAVAYEGLATALSRQNRGEEAVEHALTAVELLHNMPRAHLRLGITLARLGLYEEAVRAFETCLKLAPNTMNAHRWLARIYRSQLDRLDKAIEHQLAAQQVQQWREQAWAAADSPAL